MFAPKTFNRTVDENAENDQRLAFTNYLKAIRPAADAALSGAALAQQEEHVLRCLGAALIMQWDTLTAKLRRELFDNAGAMGDLVATQDLRGKIATFLRKHSAEKQAGAESHE